MAKLLVFAACLCSASCASLAANPIRNVIYMLQRMQTKVEQEGDAEKALFEKFMCYCKNSGGDLKASIAAAETKVPSVGTKIGEGEAKQTQLKQDIKQHQGDRGQAKQSVADALALRKKQAADFATESTELQTNIAALGKGILALEKGAGGSFLQTDAARLVKNIVASQNMLDGDRQELFAFLSGDASYAPQLSEVTGILRQLKEAMDRDLSELETAEKQSICEHESMMASKKKEMDALTAATEKKLERSSGLAVEIVQLKNDLGDTAQALADDKQFLADMDKHCATKQAEWDAACKTRSEELATLAETIKLLNDDDALELFKKTLPGASANFMQVTSSMADVRAHALKVIVDAQKIYKRTNLDFIALALHGKKIGFEQVIGMIDNMAALLKQEQTDDDAKKEYCAKQFDQLDDSKKGLERSISDTQAAISDAGDNIANLDAEIKGLENSNKNLDKNVAEATEQRKEEHAEHQELIASDSTAKEVLEFAKNRLNKFYNPGLYRAPEKRVLSEESQVVVNMGGTMAPTNAPGGIAGTGISLAQISRHDAAPPPSPETAGVYKKKALESGGVIAMIDLLINDLSAEVASAKTMEADSQADYESTMADAAAQRARSSKDLTNKNAARAETAADSEDHKDNHNSLNRELGAAKLVIYNLHAECDWLLQYFDARKAARTGEIESLNNAKAVLKGADFSLMQVKRSLRGQ